MSLEKLKGLTKGKFLLPSFDYILEVGLLVFLCICHDFIYSYWNAAQVMFVEWMKGRMNEKFLPKKILSITQKFHPLPPRVCRIEMLHVSWLREGVGWWRTIGTVVGRLCLIPAVTLTQPACKTCPHPHTRRRKETRWKASLGNHLTLMQAHQTRHQWP